MITPVWRTEQVQQYYSKNQLDTKAVELYPMNQRCLAAAIQYDQRIDLKKTVQSWHWSRSLEAANRAADAGLEMWRQIRLKTPFKDEPLQSEDVTIWRAIREMQYLDCFLKRQTIFDTSPKLSEFKITKFSQSDIIDMAILNALFRHEKTSCSPSPKDTDLGPNSTRFEGASNSADCVFIGYGIPDLQRRVFDIANTNKSVAIYKPTDTQTHADALSHPHVSIYEGPQTAVTFKPHNRLDPIFAAFPSYQRRFLTWMIDDGIKIFEEERKAVELCLQTFKPRSIHLANHAHPATSTALLYAKKHNVPVTLYEHSEIELRKKPFSIVSLVPKGTTRIVLNAKEAERIGQGAVLSPQSSSAPSRRRRQLWKVQRKLGLANTHVFSVSTGQAFILPEIDINSTYEELSKSITQKRNTGLLKRTTIRLRDSQDVAFIVSHYVGKDVQFSLQSFEPLAKLLNAAACWTEVGLPSSVTHIAQSRGLMLKPL